jgi:16S rRNA (uracil1498-N3)-methyltransferase
MGPMPRYDFRTPRLFVNAALGSGGEVALDRDQTNYLVNVLRLDSGASVLVFNGRDGEWRASLAPSGRKSSRLNVEEQARPQTAAGALRYVFAPLKHARLDYMVQKAVEMGVSHLQPVMTRHTQVQRVNIERMRANAIEAAEQCGILTVPDIAEPLPFAAFLHERVPGHLLVFCDEDADVKDPVEALKAVRGNERAGHEAVIVLVGPEGGFAEDERAALLKLPNVARLALGPRILRADTAAVAALALVQTVLGDWR